MASMIELIEIEPIVIKYRGSIDVKIKYRDFDRVDGLLNKIYFDFDIIDVLTSETIATFNQKAIKKCSDLTAVATDTITWKNYALFGKTYQIDKILEYMGSKTKLNVRIKVYSDNINATGVSYCDTTLSISTDDLKPYFNIACVDTNESTINVTGDEQKLINMLSKMTISCTDLDTYGATIKKSKFYIDGVLKANYSNGSTTLNNITVTKSANNGFDYASFSISIELTDSRGAVSLVSKDFRLINYALPSFSKWTVNRYNNTDRNIQAILEGTVSPVIIDGIARNRIESIDFRYKLTRNTVYSDKKSVDGVIQLTDDTFEFSNNALLNLAQENSYNLQIYVTDSLSTSKALNFTISKTSAFLSFRNNDRVGINNPNPKHTVDMIGDMNIVGKLLINGDDVTFSINSLASEIGLIFGIENNDDILGLCVDFENKKYTRLAGAAGKTAGTDFDKFSMYGGRKRCNVANNGEITAFFGDENYSDTINGQVMVYQPKFYYKVVPIKLEKNESGIGYHIRKANYYVTDKPLAGFKLHPAFYDENGNEIDYILYSAYEASLYDIKQKTYFKDGTMTDTDLTLSNYTACSVAMEKPISGLYKSLTKTNFEKIASQRGKGWHCETIKTLSANLLLMMIELGTMNFQSTIGQGVVSIASVDNYNCSSFTGSTRGMGNATGTASWSTNEIGGTQTTYYSADTGKLAVTYRGVENLWGNIYKHINGINVWGDGTMKGGQLYIADDFDFSETKHDDNYNPVGFTLPNENGYIKAMGYGSKEYDWLLMPSEVGGTSALPVGDYVNATADVNVHKVVMYGGMWNSASAAGGFTYYCSDGAGTKYKSFGGRIVYIPTAE